MSSSMRLSIRTKIALLMTILLAIVCIVVYRYFPSQLHRQIVDAVAQDSSRVIARARKDWESKYTLARFQEQVINVIAGCLATSGVRPTASASAIERDGLRVMRDTQGSGLVSNRREPARKWGAGGGA
jgi:hypothetical protein